MYKTREEIRAAAGHAIICGFDGQTLSAELKEILREVKPLGLILFARNIESPLQVAELNRELKLFDPRARLLCAVDQEGGRVQRVRAPATEWPSMRTLGRAADTALTATMATALGRELSALGFDVDFAPVLDVDTNPKNPVIGDRSFSASAAEVATQGAAFIGALQAAGIAACGKHFPGHGDTDLDSHKALPKVSHELSRLREVEWLPFAAAAKAGVSAIMTAHVVVEALDPDRPATLSVPALAPLRRELQFRGVIVSDDLEMKAVYDHYDVHAMATMGLKAGVDVFLACHAPEVIQELYRGLVTATESQAITHDELWNAAARARAWRDRFQAPAAPVTRVKEVVGCLEHQAIAFEISRRAALQT
ncbi:MAG: beta-N-acetylhexosaminidase [Deltaproteobacteria bacterium]|nr:beta-N-acetylhexosaminidase [Deltaproteobacteria bacterium]